eukprot:scaffold401_cov399-Prasinococcus_capsulatus_cf.AAC.25
MVAPDVQKETKREETFETRTGNAFDKIAIVTSDINGASSQVGPLGGRVVFNGPVPGIGTHVAAIEDIDGHGLVFVDYADFESELV